MLILNHLVFIIINISQSFISAALNPLVVVAVPGFILRLVLQVVPVLYID